MADYHVMLTSLRLPFSADSSLRFHLTTFIDDADD